MKLKLTVSNAIVETKRYVDQKTGNARDRVVATVGGMTTEGEMMTCVVYGDTQDDFKTLPKTGGAVVLDAYKHEAANALMGQAWARSFSPVK